MFLLCGARPYVSIVWRSAKCFYCMCGPYVFIGDCYESYHMEPSTGHVIKYYKHIFFIRYVLRNLLKTNKYELIVRRSGYLVGSRPIPMEPSTGHMIKYYKRILDIR